MFETRIRKVGNSAVVTLSSEMLAALDAREGDTVYIVLGYDGSLKITRKILNGPRHWPPLRSSWMKTATCCRRLCEVTGLGAWPGDPDHSRSPDRPARRCCG